jgi:hypothetical protein
LSQGVALGYRIMPRWGEKTNAALKAINGAIVITVWRRKATLV